MEPAVSTRRSPLRVGGKASSEHSQGECRRHRPSAHVDGTTWEYIDGLSWVGFGPKRPQKTWAKQWQNGKANEQEGESGREDQVQDRVRAAPYDEGC